MKLTFPLAPQSTALILNGARSTLCPKWFSHYSHIIATDGAWDDVEHSKVGRDWCARGNNITILGDGDSITSRPINFIEMPDQNYTDFEKALQYAQLQGLSEIDVYWTSGGEMDHFLGNLSVASKYAKTMCLRFFDDKQCYFYISSEAEKIVYLEKVATQTISLYPFPECVVNSRGLLYPLENLALSQTIQQSLRNQAVGDVELTFTGGLWVFITLTKD